MPNQTVTQPNITLSKNGQSLICSGDWTIADITLIERQFLLMQSQQLDLKEIEIQAVNKLDTAGAFLITKITQSMNQKQLIKVVGANPIHQALLDLVQKQSVSQVLIKKIEPKPKERLYLLGRWSVDKLKQILNYLNFLGELIVSFLRLIHNPLNFRWRYVFNVIEDVGCGSLAIVALMSYLIGVVLAYQLAVELSYYGVDIYVVESSGIALLREFSPLITAIIMAGKTTTSFAALIGTMKINEEVDALETMGVSPMQLLVIPRLVALLIVMPLLTVWSCFWGVVGSMMMCHSSLHIDYDVFLERFADMVQFKQYVLGMIKTPVFAIIVALVGCFQGFQVSMSADSVGKKTTKAAVQSIFLIIIADAFFSILYSWKGL
jgi:phospholipid/cholesterol/gamma-HCH transport system permease protein